MKAHKTEHLPHEITHNTTFIKKTVITIWRNHQQMPHLTVWVRIDRMNCEPCDCVGYVQRSPHLNGYPHRLLSSLSVDNRLGRWCHSRQNLVLKIFSIELLLPCSNIFCEFPILHQLNSLRILEDWGLWEYFVFLYRSTFTSKLTVGSWMLLKRKKERFLGN